MVVGNFTPGLVLDSDLLAYETFADSHVNQGHISSNIKRVVDPENLKARNVLYWTEMAIGP